MGEKGAYNLNDNRLCDISMDENMDKIERYLPLFGCISSSETI